MLLGMLRSLLRVCSSADVSTDLGVKRFFRVNFWILGLAFGWRFDFGVGSNGFFSPHLPWVVALNILSELGISASFFLSNTLLLSYLILLY